MYLQVFSAGGRAAIIFVIALILVIPACGEILLSGRILDENDAPVRDARVTLRAAGAALATSLETLTNADGAFTLELPSPGDFLLNVEREGFYPIKDRPMHIENASEVTLTINTVHEVFQSVNVAEAPSPVDISQTSNTERLTGTEINDVPYANSHSLRSSFALMPGVVEDANGGLHVNGSSENQVLYLLNGFDITNPISGQLQTVMAVEGVRSVDLSTGRYPPEYGKGSAGVMAINTENGTDRFHFTTTDFIPGLSIQQGLHLGNWYPRFGVSGPIVKGRAWFSDMFDTEYTESLVTGLPAGANTRSGIAVGNVLHTQVNLNQSNLLYADFLVNLDNECRVGLGPLTPAATTSTVDTREYFVSLKDQAYLGHGVLLEFGYAHNEFSNQQTPQGDGLYLISPLGQSGNYFVNARQTAARDEGMTHVYFPQFNWMGSHQIEAGADADLRQENGDFHRTGYEVLSVSGQLLSETLFPTASQFHVSDTEFSSYLLDTWRISRRLQLNLGIREDRDQRVSGLAWSPRAAFSWSPFHSNRTRISAGYALTHDQVTLDVLGQPLDQVAETTQYNADGTPAGPAAPTTYMITGPLALPRATNWTLNVDQQVSKSIFASAKYLRRRGTDEFLWLNTLAPDAPPSLLPLPAGEMGGAYQLINLRRDDYDSLQFLVRQTFTGQHEWMASYTRSRAITNAVVDPNSLQPLQLASGFVPMPWDAPNRVLGFAYLPVPGKRWSKNWSIAILGDTRSGYPFSVREPAGLVVGGVNSYRYPLNFDLNIALERIITLYGYRFALRGGMDNVTNQANPTAVNNVTGVTQFLQFLGDEGRHFVVRIRFFGRAGSRRS